MDININVLTAVLHEKKNRHSSYIWVLLNHQIKISIPGYHLNSSNHPDNTAHAIPQSVFSHLKFYSPYNNSENYIPSCAINITLTHTSIPKKKTIYCPSKYKIITNQFKQYFNPFDNNIIVGGDKNVKHTNWNCRIKNPRGSNLFQLILSEYPIEPTIPSLQEQVQISLISSS